MTGHENLLTETPYLIAQSGPLQGERWTLQRDRFLIGRGRECDIVVPDRQISRQHARISRTAEGVQVAFTLELVFVAHDATLPLEGPGFGRVGRLRMDARSHQVWLAGKEISPPLSAPQYRLLEVLYRQPARVVPREEVVGHVWPEAAGAGVSEQAVDALVRRLRDRLAELDPQRQYIVTVRGHGFRLDNPR